jgi:hypothetical protein
MVTFEQVKQVILPEALWQQIVEHCKRKHEGQYLNGESKTGRAYGLLAGTKDQHTLKVQRLFSFKKNVRDQEPYKTHMDLLMEQYAVPSKTPLSSRGWITDPEELKACYDACDQESLTVFGTYHAHYVGWKHDPMRDTPTLLDTVLARNSNLFSFIISMVNLAHPGIKAFYEGSPEREVPIIVR